MLVTRQSESGSTPVIAIHLVYEDTYEAWSAHQSEAVRNWLAAQAFRGEKGRVVLIADPQGKLLAVVSGLGSRAAMETLSLWHGAALSDRLPEGTYEVATKLSPAETIQFALGWEYGLYRFDRYKKVDTKSPERKQRTLVVDQAIQVTAQQINHACSMARDLINTPASDLHPNALAQAAVDVATKFNATIRRYAGDELLKENFPAVHAVGRAGSVAPELVDFE